jgi:hypothetical protein
LVGPERRATPAGKELPMTPHSLARVLPFALGLALAAPGCGSQLDDANAPADEREFAGHYVVSSITVGGQAEVYNTGGVGLNLRSGPGTGYSVLANLPDGTVVDIIGDLQNSFWKANAGGTVGWLHTNYLREHVSGGGGGVYPTNIHQVPASSSNYNTGRGGVKISMVVIHDTEGSYDGSISWFQDPASQVSAHYILRSSDGDITQMVSEGDTAWHAGNYPYNQKAIGIEHEGYMAAPTRWYTDVMYKRSAQLTAAITKRYAFPADRTHIIGHAEVPPPSTHTDPGTGWDWNKYMGYVNSYR